MIKFERASTGVLGRIVLNSNIAPIAAGAALVTAILLSPTDALATCTQVAATVTCSGATVNQNNPDGYLNSQNGLTINVVSGASVVGTSNGLDLGTGSGDTINNAGLIQGGGGANGTVNAIVTTADVTVVNNANITALTTTVGASALGVNASGTVMLTNNGGANITVTAGGSEAVGAQGNAITVNNAGTITVSGGSTVGSFGVIGLNSATVVNSGTISVTAATGVEAVGVSVANPGAIVVTNQTGGMIQATGQGGALGVAILNNGGTTNVNNAGTISGTFDAINTTGSAGTVVTNSGSISATTRSGIRVDTATITNNSGGTISGVSGIFFRNGNGASTVFNAGTITGSGGTAIQFSAGSVGNTLTLGPGFAINGSVINGTSNILQLGGTGAGTFNSTTIGTQYQNFTTFNKIDTSTWDLIGTGNQAWSVQGGTLLADGVTGIVTVQSGGTVGGNGTVAGLVINSGATAAPGGTLAGPSIGTLNVAGNVSFASGTVYQVEVTPAGQNDKIAATGTTTLSGGTVQVLAANGAYAPMTKYTIVTSGGGVSGTFANVTSNLAFLTPTLSYDAHDVFLTLARNNFSFASEALTPNQASVANALDSAPQNATLIQKLLLQTDAGVRQAFDALSGEVFASTRSLMIEDALLARQAILARLLQLPYAGTQGPMAALASGGPALAYAEPQRGSYAADFPVKAPPPAVSPDLVYWAQGVGAWGRINGDGNAAEAKRDLGGFFTGIDRRFGEWRAGIVAGYTSSNVNVVARASSASVNTGHLGGYAGTSFGAWNLRSGADLAWSAIDTNRSIIFPGFAETANTHFSANTAQLFGEIGYGVAFGQIAAEPFAGFAWVHLHTDGFAEAGGLAALNGAAGNEDVGYTTLGVHLATSRMLANGMTLTPRVSVAWQHALGDVNPTAALTFQTLGTSFTTAGAPIARDAATVDAGLDLRVTPQATLGLFYLGQLAASAQDHSVRGSFTWRF